MATREMHRLSARKVTTLSTVSRHADGGRVFVGHRVRLMSPAYVRPYVQRQKNDATDAEVIGRRFYRDRDDGAVGLPGPSSHAASVQLSADR